jgi:sirohydrochlorin cobaltochelatase
MKAILLYGHGARNPEWAQPFHRIRDAIKARDPRALVEPGFLELMRPTFDEGVACLVEQGATSIIVVPIFMAAGSHVKKDLPRLAGDAMDRHEGLLIELAAPVGEADSVLAAMAEYALGAQAADC